MRIGVTISRTWDDYISIFDVLEDFSGKPPGNTLVHGASGMDWFVAGVAYTFGFRLEAHHAEWEIYGKAAGPLRNQKMIKSDLDLLLAFIKNRSRGASGCARMAEQLGVPVRRYEG